MILYVYVCRKENQEAPKHKDQTTNETNLKASSAEGSGLSCLNRMNAPSHSKTLRIRQLNGFSRSKSLCLRIRLSRMDRIESDESS